MITEKIISDNFVDVQRIADDILKFKDFLPDFKYVYYLGYPNSKSKNILMVSRDLEDDAFASELIRFAFSQNKKSCLLKFRHQIENKYGFDSAILASPKYHSYFKGRLDNERDALYLCLPIYDCEFSGHESVELFDEMCCFLIASQDWSRSFTPSVLLRFDNPKTKGGTIGENYYPVKFDVVMNEVANLSGVSNGFIEVLNYCDKWARINSLAADQYIMEVQGNIIWKGDYSEIKEILWKFFTQ